MTIKKFEFDIITEESSKRGSLIALEEKINIPFELKRLFYIYDLNSFTSRGAHAHKISNQILICIHGSCEVLLDNGKEQKSVLLNRPNHGLLQESMIWGEMYNFSDDCILMVLSDTYYDANDYITDYNKFLELCKVLSWKSSDTMSHYMMYGMNF